MGYLISELATRHHVALLTLRAEDESDPEESLRASLAHAESIHRATDRGPLVARIVRGIRLLSAPLRGQPMWSAAFDVPEFRQRLQIVAAHWKPDIIQVEFHVMGQYIAGLLPLKLPIVLVNHEPGEATARERTHAGGRRVGWWHRVERRAWERFEREILHDASTVVVFTDRDRLALAQLTDAEKLRTIPLAVPLPAAPAAPHVEDGATILFVGNFMHPPNRIAAEMLVRDILPVVRSAIPEARLVLVGPGSHPEWSSQSGGRVTLTGRVPLVEPYLNRATVVVAPLFSGGGMRLKTLEALAHGKAVVATSRAVEGLQVSDERQVLLCDDPKQFAAAIVRLLQRPEDRARLGRSARTWAETHMDVRRTASLYEKLYEDLRREERPTRE